mmetsp:Transcript_14559/g.37017  ORF Transcript_14559/g.37017 Transcript_14559/m.37017 type:complete len:227 (-) Transcript_14559:823-1503(-)
MHPKLLQSRPGQRMPANSLSHCPTKPRNTRRRHAQRTSPCKLRRLHRRLALYRHAKLMQDEGGGCHSSTQQRRHGLCGHHRLRFGYLSLHSTHAWSCRESPWPGSLLLATTRVSRSGHHGRYKWQPAGHWRCPKSLRSCLLSRLQGDLHLGSRQGNTRSHGGGREWKHNGRLPRPRSWQSHPMSQRPPNLCEVPKLCSEPARHDLNISPRTGRKGTKAAPAHLHRL